MATLCRDCFAPNDDSTRRCTSCKSPRLARHDELTDLTMAHIDCDAFFAAIEKRDAPELRDKPVIIGGGRRGVVSTACYIARTYGVGSAMPMFKALKACPHAVVVRPQMEKYATAGRQVRDLMRDVTPLVEPVSIDEAFLDLSGTQRLHRMSAAETLMRLALRIEQEIGITVSVGLSHNKFLAKLASDLDKPRGFSIIGKAETLSRLAAMPVGKIWGVGKSMRGKLEADGITMIADLQTMDEHDLLVRYGQMGLRLARLSRGNDTRDVKPVRETKSISAETTFNEDIAAYDTLEGILWRLSDKVATRCKASDLAGHTIVLKLKTRDFKTRTRNLTLTDATQLADVIYRAGQKLLKPETDGTAYRLLGIGVAGLVTAGGTQIGDLLDPNAGKRARAERAVDKVREKYGKESIDKGRGITADKIKR
ncbi:DNA polymerase IV [Pyruvatibacter sp.]|uniref:DNA polymerase IV n=1 Tax=Pyruvatibacter sp. TaxID=1981328 RepID=UPI0032ED85AC